MADSAPTILRYNGRTVRLKWHKLRRRAVDPPFARANLLTGLAGGASMEVDLRRLACGRWVCLHDDRLEGETTGHGPVAAIDADAIVRLEMLGAPGDRPLLLDELVDIVGSAPDASGALVQLDLKANAAEIDHGARQAFSATLGGCAGRFILSGDDWGAVLALGGEVAGLALGYDPSDEVGDPAQVVRLVRQKAPQAETIYLHRKLVRAAQEQGEPIVARLREHGHKVDCWTIDHGSAAALADLLAAIAAGCDQITTNTASAWASAAL